MTGPTHLQESTPIPGDIDLDEALPQQVIRIGHVMTMKAKVNAGLGEYTRLLKRRKLMGLRGETQLGRRSQRDAPSAD